MKTTMLLKKVEEILDAKKSKQRERQKNLKKVLSMLKKRKRELQQILEKGEQSPKGEERIRKELAIVRAQRHKGIKVLRDLK